MASVKSIADEPYRRETVDFINLVFGNNTASSRYWSTTIQSVELPNRFPDCFHMHERGEHFDLRASVHDFFPQILLRFCTLCGLVLDNSVREPLQSDDEKRRSDFFALEKPLERTLLVDILPVVKRMNVMSYAQGTALLVRAVKKADKKPADSLRLGRLAEKRLSDALRSNMLDYQSLCNLGFLYDRIFRNHAKGAQFYARALEANPRHIRTLYYMALSSRVDTEREEKLRQALEISHFTHPNTLKDYANYLRHRAGSTGDPDRKDKYRTQAKAYFRHAIEQQAGERCRL